MDGKDVLCGQALPKQRDGLHSKVSYKRLDRGKFIWPQTVDGVVALTPGQMGYILEGIDWRNPQKTWRPQAAG
jgi:transposase